jgi:hypothetical protein
VGAAELVFGTTLNLPWPILNTAEPPPEFFVQQLRSGVPAVATKTVQSDSEQSWPPKQLWAATHVYVRSPAASPAPTSAYTGPYLVHRRSNKFFILKVGGKFDAVSIDRLKPLLGGNPVAVPPPKQGHPAGSTVAVFPSWR